jgi:hypothetical protein
MAIPLEGRLMWRREAPFHLQLALDKTRSAEQVIGQTQVQGEVARVFRTDGRLSEGDCITFPLWVCRAGDEPTGPAYIYHDEFVKAAFVEAYLYGSPPACELAAYEFHVIDAPTERPTLTPGELEALLGRCDGAYAAVARTRDARKWWQFWKTQRGA